MNTEFAAVTAVLQDYFDALYTSDATKLAQVFHAKAHYVSPTADGLLYRSMAEYLPIVAARPSPASRQEQRRDDIVQISFAGPHIAAARVHCTIAEKYFTDCLTLIKLDGRWQIISKVFRTTTAG